MAYPERQPAPPGAADRLLAWFGFAAHSLLRARLGPAEDLHGLVHARAARLRGHPLRDMLPPLRYQLRRSGARDLFVAECFALFCAALPGHEAARIDPATLAAARRLVAGGIVGFGEDAQRQRALELAAFALALQRDAVHLLYATPSGAESAAQSLRVPFTALGLEVGCIAAASDLAARRAAYQCPVACVPAREAGLDYLRDRAHFGGRPGGLGGALAGLAGDAPPREELLLRGLHCALVADADVVMLDEVHAPIAIARDADVTEERLLYDQALELARALRPEADFAFQDEGVQLTDAASELLGRLVAPLGGVWGARERREQLIGLALEALHLLQRDVDYRVEQGRVLFPPRPAQEAEAAAEHDAMVLKLVEAKEGCRFSARREVVARISVPGFLARYLQLAGACRDARGLAREFWSLYALKTFVAGAPVPAARAPRRLFLTRDAKRAAWLAALREAQARGAGVVLAVRTPGEAGALQAELEKAGIAPGSVTVSLAPAERNAAPQADAILLVVELHDSRRQVAGILRAYGAARGEVLLSLEDEAMAPLLGPPSKRLAQLRAGPAGEVAQPWAAWIAGLAERRAERMQSLLRQDLAARDQYLRDLLAFSGEGD